MQNHTEQRTVNPQSAFHSSGVVDEAHFSIRRLLVRIRRRVAEQLALHAGCLCGRH